MLVRVGCSFDYDAPELTHSVWQVRARPDGPGRILDEEWSAPARSHHYLDAYGNVCDRVLLPAGPSQLRYDAIVEVDDRPDATDPSASSTAVEDLPDEAFLYLLPSRYCWPELLRESAWDQFGDRSPGWARVAAVSDWVHEHIAYVQGSSTTETTALDVWVSRQGVCRDLTHLGVTLCRALNVPARYVGGYLADVGVDLPDLPMDFCSWFEAWLDGRWWTFDPRNNEPRVGRVVVARGRDALDAAMVTTWGAAVLKTMSVWADELGEA